MIKGEKISLRALEPEDLDFLYLLENDPSVWEVSNTQTPFSRFVLTQYLQNAHLDIYQAKQLRLIIVTNTNLTPIGMVDLFDFNPQHKRAGIGIVLSKEARKKGFASQSLSLLISYAFNTLYLHQLFASIVTDNVDSIQLFEKHNFIKAGLKKEWIYTKEGFKDEFFYQLIND